MNIEKKWKRTSLGEFIKLKSGFAFKSKDYTKPGEGTVPIIRISDIQQGKVYTSNAEHVPSEQADVKFLIEKGDLLIAMSGATTGKTGVYSEDNIAFLNQRVGNLKLVNEEDSCLRYRDYLVQSLQSEILKRAYGAAQPNISAKEFESIEILLAPHHEQKRIASKLDAIFEKLEMAQSRLEKVPKLLKRFRMSVLSAAVSGELTEEWRDVNNADDWEHVSLKQVGKGFNYGSSAKSKKEGSVPVLRMGNLQDGKLDWSDLVYTSDEKEIEKYKL
ncbi:restriction endonuclease subunit S, partial [Vibrio anguillarum]